VKNTHALLERRILEAKERIRKTVHNLLCMDPKSSADPLRTYSSHDLDRLLGYLEDADGAVTGLREAVCELHGYLRGTPDG
jgi:hypothetical protein